MYKPADVSVMTYSDCRLHCWPSDFYSWESNCLLLTNFLTYPDQSRDTSLSWDLINRQACKKLQLELTYELNWCLTFLPLLRYSQCHSVILNFRNTNLNSVHWNTFRECSLSDPFPLVFFSTFFCTAI